MALRPFRLRDAAAWSALRLRNEDWLRPWEARPLEQSSAEWQEHSSPAAFTGMLRVLRREARRGVALPFALLYDGSLAGQVTVSPVVRHARLTASLGYWVDSTLAGRGIVPRALALVADHCFGPVGLHRLTADVRPDNQPSLRVLEKLGFRNEGLQERLLLVGGEWRDHYAFALTAEEQPEGVLTRLIAAQNP